MYLKRITHNYLFENVQLAKDLLYKEYAKKSRGDVKNLDDETKKRILENPDWIEIRDLTSKKPGYTYLLTKFFFEEGATMEMIKSIYDRLLRYNQNLNELPMPVDKYAKVEKNDEDLRPGWERLDDDLEVVGMKRSLKELTNEFASELKEDYKKATLDQINALMDISNRAKERGEDFWKNMLGYNPETKKYNLRVHKTVDDFINHCNREIKLYDELQKPQEEGEGPYVEEIKALGSAVNTLYRDKDYLACSIRTGKAQKDLYGENWCIGRNTGTFWSYVGKRIQINIRNFSIPESDKYSLIGFTIEPDGKIHTDADKFNNRLPDTKGKYFWEVLKKLEYPERLINTLKEKFPEEVKIRAALENWHRFSEDNNLRLPHKAIVASLVSIEQNIAKGFMKQEDWDQISGEVSRIISDQMGMKKSDFLNFFKDNGLFTDATWNVFDEMVGPNYTADDMREILKATEEALDDMELVLLVYSKKKKSNLGDSNVSAVKEVVNNRDDIIKAIKARIK